MSRFRFAWFRRWGKWIALAVVVLVLPIVTVTYLEHRKRTLVWEILPAGAGLTTELQAPWLSSVLSRAGMSVSRSHLFYSYTEISFRDGSRDGRPVTRQEMQQIVQAANRLGSIRKVILCNSRAPFDAASLEPLSELKTLVVLELEGGLHDDALRAIAEIDHLRELLLLDQSSDMTPQGYAALAKLPRLEKLKIANDELSRDDLAAIAKIRSLRTLILESCLVRDAAGLHALADLPHLERLSIVDSFHRARRPNAAFERDSITALTNLPAIQELRVGRRDGLPPEFIAGLEAALPSVKVTECRPYKFVPW